VLARLAHDRVRFVVVGGVAVVLHGHARPIEDLDLVVDATPAEALRAMQSFAAAGFAPSLPLPLAMVTVLRLFDASMREVDVFARYPVPFLELDRDAVAAEVDGVPLRIASLPQLLHAKRTFGRGHDLWDVAAFAARGASGSAPSS
jgi:hypothetical protein